MFFKEISKKEEDIISYIFKKISFSYGFNEKPGSGIDLFNKKLINYCILNAICGETTVKKQKNHVECFYLFSGNLLSTSDDKENEINVYFNKAIDKLSIYLQNKLFNFKCKTNEIEIGEGENNVKFDQKI